MATEKVNLQNLRHACEQMIACIDTMSDPTTDCSGVRNFGFPSAADEIRFELDGSESCVLAVRERALKGISR